MNRYAFIIVMLYVAAVLSLTSCNPDDEPAIVNKDTVLTPGNDNSENGDDKNENGNTNSGGEHQMDRNIIVRVGDRSFAAKLENNATAHAFAALLPMTVTMNEMNGNEKYHYLSENLPTNNYRPGTINNGDLMLYGSNCLVIFYETFASSYSYTRLGRLDNPSELASALGRSNVVVTFETSNN